MNLALVFPGQGSQNSSMLDGFKDNASFRNTLEKASDILNYNITDIVQDESKLNNTIYTQPIVLAVSYAIYKILKDESNPDIKIAAGHSLGEYSALVCNNTINFRDGLLLVKKRAELMTKAMDNIDSAMAAVIGLEGNIVDEICKASTKDNEVIEAVNFNCPGQTVIAGHSVAIDSITPILKNRGAKIIKKLPVSIAAHTSLLKPVADNLMDELDKIVFNSNTFDIVHNYDLSINSTGDNLKNVLTQQVCSPVRWIETLEKFKLNNITDIIEVGPGNVLSGLVKRFDKSIVVHSTNTMENMKITTQAL